MSQEREAVARALQEQLGAAQATARKAETELEKTKAEVQVQYIPCVLHRHDTQH
jgi:hypothetical protein